MTLTKTKLQAVFNALDKHLGDTDPETDGMRDYEIEIEYPVFWAAKELTALIHSNALV